MVRGITAKGHTVHVFKPRWGTGDSPEHTVSGAFVHSYTIPDDCVESIEAIDREEPFDLFHGFFLLSAFPCLRVAKGKRPVVASVRGVDGLLNWQACRNAVSRCSWITSVSGESLDRARAIAPIENRCSVVLNSIDTSAFPKWTASSANAGVAGTVSTFRRKKNLPLLARAYSRVSPGLRRQLLLVGGFLSGATPDERAAADFAALTSDLGIANEVRITGLIDNSQVPSFLLSMRAFALSSDHEGLPNAILEAAACAVPIVATAVDGVRDMFRSGSEALLVTPGDEEGFYQALQRVLADEDLARQLSEGALSAARRLTPEREVNGYLEVYRNLLVS
ncbi:MAG: glycosyltransferase [Bryobacterales bacterium]|nr:glycosyltransferase [Bryobacterales bacterium]